MSSLPLPAILPGTLDEAQSILAGLATRWPEQQENVARSKPLWHEAVAQVDPDWAKILGATVNWLDEVPLVLMSASKNITSEESVSQYTKIASSLDALLKEVSNPKAAWFTLLGNRTTVAPADRLEELMGDKKKLDEASQARISAMQDALDLGDDARLLAAIMADAIPLLRMRIQEQRLSVDVESAPTMSEAQKRARTLKFMDRAASALDLAESRFKNESSPSATLNRDGLENMVSQEAQLHTRLNTLSGQIAKSIAGEQVDTQSARQGGQLALIALAPPEGLTTNLPAVASAISAQPKRAGFWSRLMRAPMGFRDMFIVSGAAASASSQAAPDAFLSLPVAPRLSATANGHLEQIQYYKTHPRLAWTSFKFAVQEPEVWASTKMPSGGSLLDKMISPKMWAEQHRPGSALSLFDILLERESVIKQGLCDWKRLSDICMASLAEAKTYVDESSWSAMKIIAKTGHFMDLDPHMPALAKFANVSSLRLRAGSAKYDALTQIFENLLTPEAIKAASHVIDDSHYDLSFDNAHLFSKTIKNPAISSAFSFVLITGTQRSTISAQKECDLMENLSPSDRVDLAQHLLLQNNDLSTRAKIKNLLSTSAMRADLAAPPSTETQWSFALKEWQILNSHSQSSNVPPYLLACALSMKNLPLLESIAQLCPSPELKSDLTQVDGTSQPPLSLVMELDMTFLGELKSRRDPSYWCALFSGQIDRPAVQEYSEAPGVRGRITGTQYNLNTGATQHSRLPSTRKIPMTPLMQAAYHGNREWIQALISAGVDMEAKQDDYSAISMLQNHVLKKIMRHEDKPVDISRAPRKIQETFIRKMVHAMDQTGLWNIKEAGPDSCIQGMLITAMTTDLAAGQSEQSLDASPRRNAIHDCIASLGASQFIETIVSTLVPRGTFEIDGPEVASFFAHGHKAGVITATPQDMAKVIEEIKQRQVQPVKEVEAQQVVRSRGPVV